MSQKKDHKNHKHKAAKKSHTKKHKTEVADQSTDPIDHEAGPEVTFDAADVAADSGSKEEAHFEESFQEQSENQNTEDGPEKVEFPYSDMVRVYAPKAMDVVDRAATDWKKEGSFMNLGIENPYANMAVSMGLQRAKEIAKKLEEKGVMSAVRMGLEVIKQQVSKKR